MTTAKHHSKEERDTATISVLMFAVFATAVSNSIIFAALGDLQDKYGFGDAGLGLIAGIGFLLGSSLKFLSHPLPIHDNQKT